MKYCLSFLIGCVFQTAIFVSSAFAQQVPGKPITIVIIRHAEKPTVGDNLNCQGLNRSRALPAVLVRKFGVPQFTYVPSLGSDSSTTHARMFQTVTPLAAKYNLTINSKYNGKDSSGLVADIMRRSGVVLLVWNHNNVLQILHALHIYDASLKWEDDDFDNIWIVSFKNGNPSLKKDKEGLHPAPSCE